MDPTAQSFTALANATLLQLRELARHLQIPQYSRLGRGELLAAMAEEPPGPADGRTTATPTDRRGKASKVVFQPRDPQWAYVFWEISGHDRQRALAAGAQQLCLRVADVTGLSEGASHPHTLQELVVDAEAQEWYVPIPLSDRDYRVELGYRLGGGGWLSLGVSSAARMPASDPSQMGADLFVPFHMEGAEEVMPEPSTGGGVQHERTYQLATGGHPQGQRSRRLGSEVLHEQALSRDQADQRHASGRGLQQQRSFWLVADAELIVYGATEPNASLAIGEEQIPLETDGTFRVKVPFPDGQRVYPIRAVAADGEQQRSIRMEFERRTPEAQVNRREDAESTWF
jgi:uncharacterized protein